MKDWLGQEISEGDTIIYAAMSGRSVTMVLGTVVKFNESGTVRVQPVKSSRWEQHHGRLRYIDNRTGKGIDPYSGDGKHIASEGHYVRTDTGEKVTADDKYNLYRRGVLSWRDVEYKPTAFKDYVERVTDEVKPVTLTVTENITKWTGELPADG